MTILIIEDDASLSDLLQERLADYGYDTVRVSSAGQALVWLESHTADLLLLHYSLPDMNGHEFIEALKKKAAGLPAFIVATGYGDEHLAVEMMKLGARDYVVKDRHFLELLPEVVKRVTTELENERKRQQAEEALRRSETRAKAAFEQAAMGMAWLTLEGRWLQVNQKLCQMIGYSSQELLARTLDEITHPDDLETYLNYMKQIVANQIQTYTLEQRYLHKNGEPLWVSLTVSVVREGSPAPAYLMAIIEDIARRKAAEEQLQHDALHDALTALPNRTLFMNYLARSIGQAQRQEHYQFAVLFLDLDQFKLVNDSLGHLVGDQLLLTISQRLKAVVRPGDTVTRLGGDEFAILLDDSDATEAERIAQQIQKEVSRPIKLDNRELVVTVSIGFVLSKEGAEGLLYERPEAILRDTDTAMYQAKAQGRGRVEHFNLGMRSQAEALLALETGLHQALQRQEFRLYYQPIVSLASGHITAVEALLRWQHPQRGLLFPGEFIYAMCNFT